MKRTDVLLAAGLTVAMVLEVWTEHLKPEVAGSAGMAVAGVSLAWRRVYPIAVTLLVVTITIAQASAGMSMHSAVSPVIGLLICSWSVGAYEARRRAVLGLTLLVCGLWVAMGIDVLRGTDHYEATDVPWIGTLLLLPGVLGMLFGARTRSLRAAEARATRLELERREAVAAERSRIARELHDVIAHSVAVMTIQAGAAEEMLKQDAERALEPVRAVQETGRRALAEMKHLVGMLREGDEEAGLEPQPGVGDLGRLVAHVREAGLQVELRVEGPPRPLPIGVDLSAYRVVQEALTNALKHAGAASALVVLHYRDSDLSIEVRDDGVGTTAAGNGHGLVGMRERVGVFGGEFDAGPGEHGGFAVRARLPLAAAS